MAHRHPFSCHTRCLGNWHLTIWRCHRLRNGIDWLHEANHYGLLLMDDSIHGMCDCLLLTGSLNFVVEVEYSHSS